MKKTNRNLINAILVAFIISIFLSCAPAYVPNVVNSPMLSNKGEVRLSASVGTSIFDPQAAVAITDHIGIMADGSFGTIESSNLSSDEEKEFQNHKIGEIGAGYYTEIVDNFKFEVYGGYGYGRVKGKFNGFLDQKIISDANFNRIFMQPAIGYSIDFFEAVLSSRFSYINMNLSRSDYKYGDNYSIFAEPAATIKFGLRPVKIMIQTGLSIPCYSNDLFDYNPFMFSIGLHFDFGRKYAD